MLFFLSSILNLLMMTLFQFFFAKEVAIEKADFVFLCVGLTSVLISMSTAGFSGYLISSFSSRESSQELSKDFSDKFTFLVYVFGSLSLIVGCLTYFWGVGSFDNINRVDCFFIALAFFLYTFLNSGNIFFQSYSFAIKKHTQYELLGFFSLLASLLIAVFVYDIGMLSLPLAIAGRLALMIFIFSLYYLPNRSFFICSVKSLKTVFNDVKIMIIGGAFYKSEPLVDRLLVSNVSGAITVLHLIMQIYNALLGMLFKVFTSQVIVAMAKSYSLNGRDGLLKVTRLAVIKILSICSMLFVFIFFTPFLDMVIRIEIFSVLRGYDEIVKVLFLYFSVSFIGQVISNAFYVSKKNSIPVIVSSVSFCLFLPIKFYFTYNYGLIALAWLIVAYHLINTITLSFMCRKI